MINLYNFAKSNRSDMPSGTEKFIASRLAFKGRLPMICIAVSYLVMIVAVAVSGGFRSEIRRGVGEICGDVRLIPVGQDYLGENTPLSQSAAYLDQVRAMPEVEKVDPVIYRAGIIKQGDRIHGVMFKGVPDRTDTTSLGVAIPRRLSRILGVGEGDPLLAYFVGEKVKARKFTVTEIYDGILDGDDKLVVYASLSDMQRLNQWAEDQASAFEIKVRAPYNSPSGLKRLEGEVGFVASSFIGEDDETVYASSSVSAYPQLFDWLNLLDFNVLFILILMTAVAGVNMVSGLLIMLFEHISTIGLFKSLGMTDRSIGKVFLKVSSGVVLKGMAAGNAIALLFCLVQSLTHIIPLNPENYFVSYVPVHIDILKVILADALSYGIIMLLMLIPSKFISKVDPAQTLRVN